MEITDKGKYLGFYVGPGKGTHPWHGPPPNTSSDAISGKIALLGYSFTPGSTTLWP